MIFLYGQGIHLCYHNMWYSTRCNGRWWHFIRSTWYKNKKMSSNNNIIITECLVFLFHTIIYSSYLKIKIKMNSWILNILLWLHAPFNAFKKEQQFFKNMLNRLRQTVFVKGGALRFLNVCSSVIFSHMHSELSSRKITI